MLELRYDPDPILTQVCAPIRSVDAEIRAFAEEMIQAMYTEGGVGLAAPQVGRAIRMFVMDAQWMGEGESSRNPLVFINPEFRFKSPQKALVTEGCLSFPGRQKKVWRHTTVAVQALDTNGASFIFPARDLEAQCIQHEYEHLDGKTLYEIIREESTSPGATTP